MRSFRQLLCWWSTRYDDPVVHPEDLATRFDEMARYAGQAREQVMLEVLESYLAQIAEEDARIDEARAQVARGEVIDAEEIRAEDEALLARLGVATEEIAREFEAYYGVKLCE